MQMPRKAFLPSARSPGNSAEERSEGEGREFCWASLAAELASPLCAEARALAVICSLGCAPLVAVARGTTSQLPTAATKTKGDVTPGCQLLGESESTKHQALASVLFPLSSFQPASCTPRFVLQSPISHGLPHPASCIMYSIAHSPYPHPMPRLPHLALTPRAQSPSEPIAPGGAAPRASGVALPVPAGRTELNQARGFGFFRSI
jgi:hypothetical protein